jgi:hypothetical protein
MFYTGSGKGVPAAVGYAESNDGIHWNRYHGNPVLTAQDDPFLKLNRINGVIENPFLLSLDTVVSLYYDHGTPPGTIGVASARVR